VRGHGQAACGDARHRGAGARIVGVGPWAHTAKAVAAGLARSARTIIGPF
jgi:hypothetical protein